MECKLRPVQPSRRAAAAKAILAAALVFGALPATFAQSFPNKAIRLIVPAEPGGGLDIPARTLAQGLSQRLGQQVFVEIGRAHV